MVPHDTQEKKGNAILEGLQKAKQQEELLRSMRKGSNGSLLGAPNAMIFESEKLKQKKIFSPESHVKLAQELPNHKVSVCFHFCLLNCWLLLIKCEEIAFCPRFWWIVSWIRTLWLQGSNLIENILISCSILEKDLVRFLLDLKTHLSMAITSACPSCR